MSVRDVQLRAGAAADVDEAVTSLRRDAGSTVALAFVDALEQGLARIARSPHIGSLRFAYDLSIPELRAWGLKRFPYLIFYVASDDRIDVWRVLHARRDLPSTLRADD